MRRIAPPLAALILAAACVAPGLARASTNDPAAQGALAVFAVIPDQFAAADPTHDAVSAARVRALASTVAAATSADPALRAAAPEAQRLGRTLAPTRVRLQPWPLPQTVRTQSVAAAEAVRATGVAAPATPTPYAAIDRLLATAASAHSAALARVEAAGAWALFEQGPGRRLAAVNGALAAQTQQSLWNAVSAADRPGESARARTAAEADLQAAAAALGDESVSRATVVADAGVIVFREGLEAVLILAAITASFTGTRRRLRRPVLAGALVGLLATVLTYVLAQTIVAALGDGGLRLQAITGVLAIAVLLVVTNWFFHRVYWSEWISRFNRRRRAIERVDRLGFISGQTAAFLLLGLTSVYREGFETVLFLQNLQVSAGTGATVLGVAFGLAATTAVGVITFALERKLPYRKMLIATGVLIGLVLAIMTGTTIHNLQGLGWVPTSATGFQLDLSWGRWLGLYPTWEGIGAQLSALLVVYGSYTVARALQKRRRALNRTGDADRTSRATHAGATSRT